MSAYKEGVYDSRIRPLIGEIIKICEQHKVAAFMQFDCGVDLSGRGHVMATTALLDDDFEPDHLLLDAYAVAGPNKSVRKKAVDEC